MRITRRGLQVCLGILWLLDGALQLQPVMLTRQFARVIIKPAGVNQAAPVHLAVSLAASLIGHSPAVFDALFATVQIALGLGLLLAGAGRVKDPWPRAFLAASVLWALGVWVGGEGLGGLLGSQATAFAGAPGAALLYALLAIAAWPRPASSTSDRLANDRLADDRLADDRLADDRLADDRLGKWVPIAWAALWALLALLEVIPAERPGRALSSSLMAALPGLPGPLAAAASDLSSLVDRTGMVVPEVLAALFVVSAVGALWPGLPRALATWLGGLTAIAIWVLPEAFGGIGTGLGTDPNTGPLLVLLALATVAATPIPLRLVTLNWRRPGQGVLTSCSTGRAPESTRAA